MRDYEFFKNQTANADSPSKQWMGDNGAFFVVGTFDTCTVKLQAEFVSGEGFVDVPNVSLTAPGMVSIVDLPPCTVRANVASVSGPTDVTARAREKS